VSVIAVAWHILLLLLGHAHNYSIVAGSMIPALRVGDVVELHTTRLYGFGAPLGLPPPRVGDLVLFRNPPTGENYIKRVVGISGDAVQIVDGRLYINDEIVPRTFEGNHTYELGDGTPVRISRYRETLPTGVAHEIDEISDHELMDNTERYTVPPGALFVLGDSRDNSADSRVLSMVGYVDVRNVLAMSPGLEALFYWYRRP